MDLQTVEIPRTEARESYLAYRRQAKLERDAVARRELEELANAFRIAAKEDLALIALSPTLTRGGFTTRTRVWNRGRSDEHRGHWALPNLAVAVADARFCYTLGIEQDGRVTFTDSLRRQANYRRGVVSAATTFDLPDGYHAGRPTVAQFGEAWSAMVPIVPPKLRPRNGTFGLAGYHVLFEAEEWSWSQVPRPPGDPALLKHVGGDIYAVLATWDLSPLEQVVLSGRTPGNRETGL